MFDHRPSWPASPVSVPSSGAESSVTPRRVLVVDDNDDAATTMADALALFGNEVVVAKDGPSALEIARWFKPDVAVLDLGLPLMDGYELAQRLRELEELPPHMRLVAATGYGQRQDQEKTRAAGFSAHLVKPIELGTLLAAIRGT